MKSQKFKFSENPNDKTGESSDSDDDDDSGSSTGGIGNDVYLMTSSTMNEQDAVY